MLKLRESVYHQTQRTAELDLAALRRIFTDVYFCAEVLDILINTSEASQLALLVHHFETPNLSRHGVISIAL